jgi:hypothetical protein
MQKNVHSLLKSEQKSGTGREKKNEKGIKSSFAKSHATSVKMTSGSLNYVILKANDK